MRIYFKNVIFPTWKLQEMKKQFKGKLDLNLSIIPVFLIISTLRLAWKVVISWIIDAVKP